MKPSPRFITAPLDEGLIVARQDGDRLFVMNGSARFMWEKRAEGISDADIPRLTALHYNIDVEQARHDFGKTLRQWQAVGLAQPPGKRRYYVMGGVSFIVNYPDERLESALSPLFAHLERSRDAANGQSPTEFNLAIEEGQFVLRTDGIEVLRSVNIDVIIERLTLAVVLHAYDRIDWLVSMHAAAIGTRGHCVLIPGASGSGKSTLSAALLASKHRSYLTDDLSLLDPATLRIVPSPGTFVLKSGSWEVLKSLLPEVSELPIRRRDGQEVRYWSPPAAQVAADPLVVRAIVFARYAHGDRTEFVPLSPLEGLSRLMTAPCTVRGPITSETVDRVAGWARVIPFYTLAYGSLGDAMRIVGDLLEP